MRTVLLLSLLAGCAGNGVDSAGALLSARQHAAEEVCACASAFATSVVDCLADLDPPDGASHRCLYEASASEPTAAASLDCQRAAFDEYAACARESGCDGVAIWRCRDAHEVARLSCASAPPSFDRAVRSCEWEGESVDRIVDAYLTARAALRLDDCVRTSHGLDGASECHGVDEAWAHCAAPMIEPAAEAVREHAICFLSRVPDVERCMALDPHDLDCRRLRTELFSACPLLPRPLLDRLRACSDAMFAE